MFEEDFFVDFFIEEITPASSRNAERKLRCVAEGLIFAPKQLAMNLISFLREALQSFVSLFFPRCCPVCGLPLGRGEECLCTLCNINLPRTDLHLQPDNRMERLFWGKFPLERASAYFYYRKSSAYRFLIHRLKYGGQKESGLILGRQYAAELLPSGFFTGIDILIPLPLHPKKQRSRGYNQSEWLARGISEKTDIPIDTEIVSRIKHTDTQTRKSVSERWENMEGVFALRKPEACVNKHVLIIDDVLTTGATVTACASALATVEGVRVSVLTIALRDG